MRMDGNMKLLFEDVPITDMKLDGMTLTVIYAGIPHKIDCGSIRGIEYFSDKYRNESFNIGVKDLHGKRLIVFDKIERIHEWVDEFRL